MAAKLWTDDLLIMGKTYTCEPRVQDLAGHIDADSQKITYSIEQHEHAMKDTMLHEVLHALFHEMGIAHDLENNALPVAVVEESVIRRLTPSLLMFIRDNGEFIDWLYA